MNELPPSRASDYSSFRRAVLADAEQHLSVDASAARAPALSPDLKGDDLYAAAKASFDRGNYKGALELYKKVLDSDPKHKTAWMDLGRTYMMLRQTGDAIVAFKKQVELNPYDEYGYSALGWAYTTERSYGEAAAAFSKAIEINPLSDYAHAALGSMYGESHQYLKAVGELEKAVALKPDDSPLEVSLGNAYLNLGQDEKALAAFDRATQLSPTPEVWNNIAYQLSLKQTHLDRAQQYAESAVTAVSNTLRNLSLEQLSEHDLQMVSELDANWDTLGWVYFARGDLEKAERYVNAAWQLGEHGEVGDHLAQIYEKRGRREDAVRTYAMALSGLRPALETKGRLARLAGGDAKVPDLVERNRLELKALRRVELERVASVDGSAEFFVIVSSAHRASRIEAAKFISGEEKLKPLGDSLAHTALDFAFPDGVPTRIVRRGVLSCAKQSRQCEFLMLLPEDVHSID
jgi:tetratricopeptide (TPR) repeat protein